MWVGGSAAGVAHRGGRLQLDQNLALGWLALVPALDCYKGRMGSHCACFHPMPSPGSFHAPRPPCPQAVRAGQRHTAPRPQRRAGEGPQPQAGGAGGLQGGPGRWVLPCWVLPFWAGVRLLPRPTAAWRRERSPHLLKAGAATSPVPASARARRRRNSRRCAAATQPSTRSCSRRRPSCWRPCQCDSWRQAAGCPHRQSRQALGRLTRQTSVGCMPRSATRAFLPGGMQQPTAP